jgi:signal transduction histidine kinase
VEAVHGFGLTGLRERARSLGGRVGVESTPGEGFALEIEVPA